MYSDALSTRCRLQMMSAVCYVIGGTRKALHTIFRVPCARLEIGSSSLSSSSCVKPKRTTNRHFRPTTNYKHVDAVASFLGIAMHTRIINTHIPVVPPRPKEAHRKANSKRERRRVCVCVREKCIGMRFCSDKIKLIRPLHVHCVCEHSMRSQWMHFVH